MVDEVKVFEFVCPGVEAVNVIAVLLEIFEGLVEGEHATTWVEAHGGVGEDADFHVIVFPGFLPL